MPTSEFLERFANAFECLHAIGLSRRRVRETGHEYEVWYSNRRHAVRLTLERQWSYEYLFVQFFQRAANGLWQPVFYLEQWLKSRGWDNARIEALLKASEPVPDLPEETQKHFLSRVAEATCACASEIFGANARSTHG